MAHQPDVDIAERNFRALTDVLPQIIMTSNSMRRLNYANKFYEAYTGILSAEVAERWREAIHPDDLVRIDSSRARGGAFEIEYRLRRVDGVYRWHVATTYQIPPETGVTGWLAAAIDIDDGKRAEESLRFLERAGTQLAQSLDLQTTFDVILNLVVPDFADWATISLRDDDDRIRTMAVRHRDPAKAHLTSELTGASYFRADYDNGTLAAYRTGEAVHRSQLGRDFVVSAVQERFIPIIEELGYGSVLAVPIFGGDDVIGSMTLNAANADRHYASTDLRGIEELARRASFAIANARRFEREHRVAQTLQAAALPQRLPSLPGLRFDSYYRAGRSEAMIGGDWYDAVVIPDGRVVVSVGDVVGSGLAAAVRMSTMRQVLRAAARTSDDPAAILDLADRTLRDDASGAMVTAFVSVIDPVQRTIRFASAGHVPPLLRTVDGAITSLDGAGPPLGCGDLAKFETGIVPFPPHACLLLYTDGLIEWSRDVLEGETRLRDCFSGLAVDALERPAQSLVDHVLAGRFARDDIAALTLLSE